MCLRMSFRFCFVEINIIARVKMTRRSRREVGNGLRAMESMRVVWFGGSCGTGVRVKSDKKSHKKIKRWLVAVRFELTPPKRPQLECGALDQLGQTTQLLWLYM